MFHDFHASWIVELKKALNGGILPADYYALAEQMAGEVGPDVLTLHTGAGDAAGHAQPEGMTAVAAAPPTVNITATAAEMEAYALKRRTLVIRHASDDEIVAMVEILSPGNKYRERGLERFLDKAVSALRSGCHLLLIDLHPPRPYDPQGIHGALSAEFGDEPYRAPPGKPLTLAAYAAAPVARAYVEPIAVGSVLPAMPLFLEEGWYVNVPLEPSHQEAYASVPLRWRRVTEGQRAPA
ncbi:MAG: DUF4058 family protein [Planctomycetes bacterium]|nr:DUF4058 family protein [Planctomycetota bacterium]